MTDLLENISDDGPLSRAQRDHAGALTALAEAEATLQLAVASYDVSLGQGRDAAVAARRNQSDAEVDRDVARRMVEVAAERLEAAKASAATARAQQLALAAQAKLREFQDAARRELKAMARQARSLARRYAEAGAARDAAIRGGADEADLPSIESFRFVPGFPREVVKTERVERYIHPYTGNPIDGEQIAYIRMHGPSAFLMGASEPIKLTDKATFDRTEVLLDQSGPPVRSFLDSLSVPGLMIDDAPGWSPPRGLSHHAVLAHLEILEGADVPDRSDRRERRIEFRRVPASELVPAGA